LRMSFNYNNGLPMNQANEQFKKYLSERGLRFTPQRRAVLDQVFEMHGHFDAEDLYNELRNGGNGVSRATVYRTLKHLEECKLVREVLRCQDRAQYEHTLGHPHHDHMVCVKCGKIIEFSDPAIEAQQRKICKRHGFKPLEHRLGIRGICEDCQRKEGKREKDADDCG